MRRVDELNSLIEDPAFWETPTKAQSIMREHTRLVDGIKAVDTITIDLRENIELLELGVSERDTDTIHEAEQAIFKLGEEVEKARVQALLSGEVDSNDCYIEIHPGAGGTEAQDWAGMMLRMYSRWADKRDYKLDWLEQSSGEEAGIKSVTVRVNGVDAYGWLKTESGVHRLVRISPFDSNARRHTSFASVWVYPVIDENIIVDFEEKDLRIDTYRASGAGGQHINKTDSAIRITHIPSGIVVQCQNDRSQHRNRAAAYEMLRARLYELELQKREDAAQAEHQAKTDIGWGHQIRSYVLQPYQMIKDLRTEVETSDTQGVLDGDLDMFLMAALAARIKTN
jgi:peptide chain release factor 2